jgi:NAD(P)-dependent dehydrogenase (short-subunit alcohol dehydrogenase family)
VNDFLGAVVLVTGGASGIGRACAQAFAAAGASVVVADLDGPSAEDVAKAIGGRSVTCDVTDEAAVRSAVEFAVAEFGRLDVMVNNAGICVIAPVHETSAEDFERMLAVNLKGTLHGIQAAAAHMLTAGGGSIVNVASTAGLNGAPLIGGYGATKAAVVSLTRTAAAELRPGGVRVNCVCPGFVQTPFSDALVAGFEAATGASAADYFATKQGRLGQPEDVAKVVLHLADAAQDWVTGTAYVIDGGLMAASI